MIDSDVDAIMEDVKKYGPTSGRVARNQVQWALSIKDDR